MKQCLSPFCFQKKKATVAVSKVSTLLHVSAEPDEGKIKALLLPMYVLPLHELAWVTCLAVIWMRCSRVCICAFVCVCVCAEGSVEREDSSDLNISFRGQNKQSPS